jgi:hypothetical protein
MHRKRLNTKTLHINYSTRELYKQNSFLRDFEEYPAEICIILVVPNIDKNTM